MQRYHEKRFQQKEKPLNSTDMKKILLALGITSMLLGSNVMQARTLGWGLTGGMNVSKIDLDKNYEEMAKPEADKGWYAGITGLVSVPILGFGFDGSIVYSQDKLSKDGDSETAQFISIPVHLRYDFRLPAVEKAFVPYRMAGPQFNYALTDVKFAIEEESDAKTVLKKANSWRLDFGLGMILLDHVQLTYSYGIPIGPSQKIHSAGEVENTYKSGAHRLGMAIYF